MEKNWFGVCEGHLLLMKKDWHMLEGTPNKEHSCMHLSHPTYSMVETDGYKIILVFTQ